MSGLEGRIFVVLEVGGTSESTESVSVGIIEYGCWGLTQPLSPLSSPCPSASAVK